LRATDYDFSIFQEQYELLFLYNTKEEIDVMVEAEKSSTHVNNLNDENTIFTTIDCFSWEELRGTKQARSRICCY
jgi:hypothetical protein